jgi:hypothetical protein
MQQLCRLSPGPLAAPRSAGRRKSLSRPKLLAAYRNSASVWENCGASATVNVGADQDARMRAGNVAIHGHVPSDFTSGLARP